MIHVEPVPRVTEIGHQEDHVEVSIGPQFLELFSEHLYSSPNKAFEELVSNSWDAGALTVHIGVPTDLSDPAATVWVLDDGESMDLNGLHALWAVAKSNKRTVPPSNGRPQIGKFGIGKLATYILADQITYICKGADGAVRAVTMDYRDIHDKASSSEELHNPAPVKLPVRRLEEEDLKALLDALPEGERIGELIGAGIPRPPFAPDMENEFNSEAVRIPPKRDTWTIALLTSLKPAGRKMQPGWIRRLLRTALPLGDGLVIVFNDKPLDSAKIDCDVAKEWAIGSGLGISSVALSTGETYEVVEATDHVAIEGIGKITGRVRLYEDLISGGKSDAIGASNGFFINIRGRVINVDDQYIGLENLNHSAWARFRATVQADGLDAHLAVNREGLLQSPEVDAFRRFLLALFNKAPPNVITQRELRGRTPATY